MSGDLSNLMNGHVSEPKADNQDHSGSNKSVPNGKNKYLHLPELGLQLCAQLIAKGDSTDLVSKMLKDINATIETDFLTLAKTDENTIGALTYSELQKIEKQIEEIAVFPHLEKYYTVAVGGSFSAGKSRFLNSVLGCPSLLPTDTTPTTSIPTYISKGNKNNISALNFHRKKTEIDEEALKAICHAFNQKFNVTFSHILQLISVERENFKYPNLVFLDTPGYSKADDIINKEHNTDENIAREHLRSADYLIWLVDQQNGTIPQPDIEFLQSLNLKQPVLVVISKADKKPASQIQQIITNTQVDLQRAEVEYLDVIAYSAQSNEELSSTGNVLTDLLNKISLGKNGSAVLWQLQQIFKQYLNYYDTEKQTLSLTSSTIKELVFEESISDDKKQHLNDIRQKTKVQTTKLTQQKKQAEKVYMQLAEQITALCEQIQVITTMQPSSIALQAVMHKQQIQTADTQQYTFDALIKGDVKQLSNLADLTAITGTIIKLTAVGVHVDINMNFEIIILKQKIHPLLGDIPLTQSFTLGQDVSVQVMSNKKATVTAQLLI